MSIEQKYRKYKQKYLNLKKELDLLENNNSFNLSDTPQDLQQKGGYDINLPNLPNNVDNTPQVTNFSGETVLDVNTIPDVPAQCDGMVNPNPSVDISSPVQPLNVQKKHFSENELSDTKTESITTTELNDKYSDIEKMVNQLGGNDVYDPFNSDGNDDMVSLSNDLDNMSENEEENGDDLGDGGIAYSPIASDRLPPGENNVGVRTGLARGDAPPFQ